MTAPDERICACETHLPGAVFYVTARRQDGHFALVSGPFATHQDALDAQPEATRWAWEADPRAPWYAYGTTAVVPDGEPRQGAYQRAGAAQAHLRTMQS